MKLNHQMKPIGRVLLVVLLTVAALQTPLWSQGTSSPSKAVQQALELLDEWDLPPNVEARIRQMLTSSNESNQKAALAWIKEVLDLMAQMSESGVPVDRVDQFRDNALKDEGFNIENARESAGTAIVETLTGLTPGGRRIIGGSTAMDLANRVIGAMGELESLGGDRSKSPVREALQKIVRDRLTDPDAVRGVVDATGNQILDQQGFPKGKPGESLNDRLSRIGKNQETVDSGKQNNASSSPGVSNNKAGNGGALRNNDRPLGTSRPAPEAGIPKGTGTSKQPPPKNQQADNGATNTQPSAGNTNDQGQRSRGTVISPEDQIQVGNRQENTTWLAVAEGEYISPQGDKDPYHGKHAIMYEDMNNGTWIVEFDDGTVKKIGYFQDENGEVHTPAETSNSTGGGDKGSASGGSSNSQQDGNDEDGDDNDDDGDDQGEQHPDEDSGTGDDGTEDSSESGKDPKEEQKGTPNPDARSRSGKNLSQATQGRMGVSDTKRQQQAIAQRRGRGATTPAPDQAANQSGILLTKEQFNRMQMHLDMKGGAGLKNPGPDGARKVNPAVTERDLRDIEAKRGQAGAPGKKPAAPVTGAGPVPGTAPQGPAPNGQNASSGIASGSGNATGSGNTGGAAGTGGSTGNVIINRPGVAPAPPTNGKTDQLQQNTNKVNTNKLNSGKKN